MKEREQQLSSSFCDISGKPSELYRFANANLYNSANANLHNRRIKDRNVSERERKREKESDRERV